MKDSNRYELDLPLWFLHKEGKDAAKYFDSIEGLGLYVEYYHPVDFSIADLSDQYIILDNKARRLDISIEKGIVRYCHVAEDCVLDEDKVLLETMRNTAVGYP